MPRSPRADEAGGLYHALNRGNFRVTIFNKDADYVAFEKILHEGLEIHQVELYSYQLMPNHYHLVLRPLVDGEMSRFMGWVGGTHTMRYHAHNHTSGLGHLYQQRYKSFPIQDDGHFFVVCRYVERNALRAGLVDAPRIGSGVRCGVGSSDPNPIRSCSHRGRWLACPVGPTVSTNRYPIVNWQPFGCRPNEGVRSVTTAGWNRSHGGSISNRRCVPEAARGCDSPRNKPTKRPDPFLTPFSSDCFAASFAGADADAIVHRQHEDLAVTDLATLALSGPP